MPALPHWEDPEAPWDKLTLGVHVMPGVWEITGGECFRQIDEKKSKDKDSARIRDMGLRPPRLQARGRLALYTPSGDLTDEWDRLQQVMPDINPKKPGGLKQPLSIYHPAAALLGITTIYVERVRPPEVQDGILELAIDMIEWTAEPKKTKVASKAKVATSQDTAIMVEQLRGAGQWRSSTLQAANNPDDYDSLDADIAALTGNDTRNPPEFSAVRGIDPSEGFRF